MAAGDPAQGRRGSRDRRRGDRGLPRLPAQLPRPPQAGPAGDQGRPGGGRAPPRGRREGRPRGARARRRDRRTAFEDRADDHPPRRRGRQAVRLRHLEGDRRRDPRGARARIDRKRIRLEEPIREVGTYMVEVEVPGGATAIGQDHRRRADVGRAGRRQPGSCGSSPRIRSADQPRQDSSANSPFSARAPRLPVVDSVGPARGAGPSAPVRFNRAGTCVRQESLGDLMEAATANGSQRSAASAAAEPRGRGVGARRDDGLRGGDRPGLLDVRLEADDFYRGRHRIDLSRRSARSTSAREPIDALTVSELLREPGQARGGRRPRARSRRSPRARRSPATPATTRRSSSRTRCCAACSAPPSRSRVSVHEPRRRAARARRAGRAAALQRRPRRAGERLQLDRRDPRRRDRAAREARQRRDEDDRHPVRLPQARRDDRRLPARQPDRPRRPPGDGQVEPRLQHRRERRLEGEDAGRLLLARDVGDRARPPLHRLAGADLLRPAAQGPGDQGVEQGPQRLQRARRGAAVDRRLLRPQPARPARQGPAPALQPRAASG